MTCMSQRASAAMMAAGVAAMAAAAGLAVPALAQDSVYLGANIDGRQVPSGGEDGATADFNAAIDLEKGEICYYLDVLELPDAEAASINHAKAGESGPAVATLPLPQGGDEVCTMVDKAVLAAIAREPAGYYVAVRTPSHPDGAIRGQLN